MTFLEEVQAFFVLNAVGVSEEYEMLARLMCGSLTYTDIKDMLKKVFADIS